jgi:subtilase family serine protease
MAYAVVASAALAAGTVGLSPTADAAARGHQLPGSVPSWANASHKVGTTKASTPVDFRVYLDSSGGDAAAQYALAASTPGTKTYGHFLTSRQFNTRFAPSTSTVSAVKDWLQSQGFKVGVVPSNRRYVEAVGTVGAAAKAFGTSFAEYKVQGKTLRSNSSPLVVPSSLTDISGVVGLDESMGLVHTDAGAPAGFRNARPCSTYWGEKTVQSDPPLDGTELPAKPADWAPCGYAGAQLQGAYGMTAASGTTGGNGVRVAIIDAYASNTIDSDANTYFSKHGLPQFTAGQFTQHVAPGTYVRPENPAQFPEEWSGEETLDVEAVHTMAPGANILYVGSPNNYQDMDAAMNWIVSRHSADIVTNSYGFAGEALPPGYIKPFNDILIQAAAEGISEFFSSGDFGDETFGNPNATPTPDWPASSPWVTAVGGTSMGVGATNNRLWELGWETGKECLTSDPEGVCPKGASPKTGGHWSAPTYQYGSGGGTSRLFAQPSYQQGVSDDISTTHRVVPDVSALGDPTTGMLVGQTQRFPDGTHYGEYRIGGTSLSSPLYAGMFALVVQQAGHNFGLANPALYSDAAVAATNDILPPTSTDPTGAVRPDYVNGLDDTDGYVYSVRLFDYDSVLSIHVRDGYDDVTGLGSPTGQAWIDALAAQ